MMKPILVAGALFAIATNAQALTVQTTNFLTGSTNYNGFEGLGDTTSYNGAPYTEQGITVEYVGSLSSIWSSSQAAEGLYSWYANGGSTGYTKITFGGVINAVKFQAGSGFFGANVSLTYDVLLSGVSVGTGAVSGLSNYPGFKFYGFSGASFDEIRLQGVQNGTVFNPGSFEAGAYDAINFGGTNAVPEPASWALLIAGFSLVGAAARRSRTTRVTA